MTRSLDCETPGLGSTRRRLRVGIIAPPWLPVPPVRYGGTENVIDILARGLVAAGVDVVLATTGDADCPVPRRWVFPRALGVGNGGVAEEACHVIGAYSMLSDVDIVHDNSMVGPIYALSVPSPPVVTTNHGPFNKILTPVYQAISQRTPVIAISNHQASQAHGISIAAVIHHGIDVERIPFGLGTGGYAAVLGRMHPDKGIEEAISAARAAGMPLRIAAKMTEHAEREYFNARVAPHLGGDIEYVGELGRNDKYDLLKDAICLLNPIRWAEPFGMVMIEAMACGTPIVTNDRGSAPEIVDHGETGFLCNDESSLVASLHKVTSLDRSRCRAVVEQRFSSRRMAADHIALYRRVISGVADYPDSDRLGSASARGLRLEGAPRGHHSTKSALVPVT
ncbi:MAG TPA: glycosyltransferase family 4 protein [Acidimicrobiales bacterium]|nr:glycosyltransferase family 4 protein [Acidimicrobiales bacterium]